MVKIIHTEVVCVHLVTVIVLRYVIGQQKACKSDNDYKGVVCAASPIVKAAFLR